jgi:hypothetical protein
MRLQPMNQFSKLICQGSEALRHSVRTSAQTQNAAVNRPQASTAASAHDVTGSQGERPGAPDFARRLDLQLETAESDYLRARVDTQDPDHRHGGMVASVDRTP